MDLLTWLLQPLILTLGIYLFLRFLRTTQGNRIVRGLVIAVPSLIIITWGLAYTLQLEELRHILRGVAGFAVVFVAILFQEELRRGMAQFGANPLIRRFVPSFDTDVIEEVCRAALDMATKQETHGSFTRIRPHGALICFERESSLQSYIEGGRRIEARVSHELLEAIFQPKSPLHDGAVVIRKDRIAAASCMLPLTQDLSISKTTGTRHRAAIGLSEETDAVVLVVSEETGKLSIAAGGKLTGVPQGDLADELRAALGQAKEEHKVTVGQHVKRFLSEDLPWLAGSVLIALLMLFIARQDIAITREFLVHLVEAEATGGQPPRDGEIVVALPSEYRLSVPSSTDYFVLEATGSRAQIDQLGLNLAGTFTLEDLTSNESFVDADAVAWLKSPPLGVSLDWQDDAPRVVIERYSEMTVDLAADMVLVIAGDLDPYFQLGQGITFGSSSITIEGPESALAEIAAGGLELRLEGITLGKEDHRDRTELLDLSAELKDRACSLAGDQLVSATVPILPAAHELTVRVPVSLIGFSQGDMDRCAEWSIPANALEVDFLVRTSGIVPTSSAGTQLGTERRREIKTYIERNLTGFIDIAGQPEGQAARGLKVEPRLSDPDWRRTLDPEGELDRADLTIHLNENFGLVFLEASPSGDDS